MCGVDSGAAAVGRAAPTLVQQQAHKALEQRICEIAAQRMSPNICYFSFKRKQPDMIISEFTIPPRVPSSFRAQDWGMSTHRTPVQMRHGRGRVHTWHREWLAGWLASTESGKQSEQKHLFGPQPTAGSRTIRTGSAYPASPTRLPAPVARPRRPAAATSAFPAAKVAAPVSTQWS